MFNLFKSKPQPKPGEIWVYLPDFEDIDRGSSVEIVEVGNDVIETKHKTGQQFKQYIEKKKFLNAFKKFK